MAEPMTHAEITEAYDRILDQVAANAGLELDPVALGEQIELATVMMTLAVVLGKKSGEVENEMNNLVRFINRENPTILRNYFGGAE